MRSGRSAVERRFLSDPLLSFPVARVRITYCLPCRYQAKALQDGDTLLREFGRTLDALELIPGDHGVYDVTVDGQLVYSLDEEHRFPETLDLVRRVRSKIPGAAGAKA